MPLELSTKAVEVKALRSLAQVEGQLHSNIETYHGIKSTATKTLLSVEHEQDLLSAAEKNTFSVLDKLSAAVEGADRRAQLNTARQAIAAKASPRDYRQPLLPEVPGTSRGVTPSSTGIRTPSTGRRTPSSTASSHSSPYSSQQRLLFTAIPVTPQAGVPVEAELQQHADRLEVLLGQLRAHHESLNVFKLKLTYMINQQAANVVIDSTCLSAPHQSSVLTTAPTTRRLMNLSQGEHKKVHGETPSVAEMRSDATSTFNAVRKLVLRCTSFREDLLLELKKATGACDKFERGMLRQIQGRIQDDVRIKTNLRMQLLHNEQTSVEIQRKYFSIRQRIQQLEGPLQLAKQRRKLRLEMNGDTTASGTDAVASTLDNEETTLLRCVDQLTKEARKLERRMNRNDTRRTEMEDRFRDVNQELDVDKFCEEEQGGGVGGADGKLKRSVMTLVPTLNPVPPNARQLSRSSQLRPYPGLGVSQRDIHPAKFPSPSKTYATAASKYI